MLTVRQKKVGKTAWDGDNQYFNYSAGDDTGEVLLATASSLSRTISVAYSMSR